MNQWLVFVMAALFVVNVGRTQEPESPEPAQPAEENATPSNNDTEQPEAEYEDDSKITDLPLLEDLEIPSAEELLTGEHISWIIVVNDRVVFSRAISPRPHTLERQAEELESLRKKGTPSDPVEADKFQDRVRRLRRIQGGFPGSSQYPEFLIEVRNVKDIWHHEDLMLKRADLLMEENELNQAYELLFELQTTHPNWPGLEQRHHKLMFLDGISLLESDRLQAALSRFEELYRLKPDYPELVKQIALCAERLISAAVGDEEFRKARHFLHRVEKLDNELSVVSQWSDRLMSLMEDVRRDAVSAFDRQQFSQSVSLIQRAAEIWPYDDGLEDDFERISRRYQRLTVGVLRPAGSETAYPFPLPSDDRHGELRTRPLFEIHRYDGSPHYRTTLIEQWEPTELGRHLLLELRTDFDYWSSQRPLTAMEVSRSLALQMDAGSAAYDERLSGYVRAVRVHSPYRLELEFSRAPLRPEALLHRNILGSEDSGPRNEWFRESNRTARTSSWLRSVPEPQEAPLYHVAEVRETGFENHEEVLRAFFRGRVDYLPSLPLRHVSELRERAPWVVRQYTLPETHLLQFHPRSLCAESGELRRALLYAIDREKLLTEVVLQDAPREFGRLTTSPIPARSESYSPLVQPFEPDLRVGLSLALAAAKRQGGTLPVLKMVVPPDPDLRPVVDRLIQRWQRIGVEVVVIDPAGSGDDSWDIAYRRVSIAEPLTELWPLLTMQSKARVSDLQQLPGWLRQELIRLDLATNWDDANSILFRLHEHLWQEVYYLPLWELDRYSIARREIRGIPDNPLRPYQDLSSWTIDPSFDATRP